MSNYTPTSDARPAPEQYHILNATLSITADAATTEGEYLVLTRQAGSADVRERASQNIEADATGLDPEAVDTHEQSEVFHVIACEARLHVDGREQTPGPGTSGYVSGGEVHGFANDGEEVRRVIAVTTPGGVEGFVREAGQPTGDRTLPDPIEPTEEMLQSPFATGGRHGFEFPGPLPERGG
jgi:mannose-6-phosphate isomerase-like protein (cupin superfamily)